MGLYRKRGNEQAALESVQTGLSLMHRLHLEKEISGATTYLNAATVYKSFHMASKALPLYQHAKEIYEKNLPDRDPRLGGLYNNMALALVDLKQYQERPTARRNRRSPISIWPMLLLPKWEMRQRKRL